MSILNLPKFGLWSSIPSNWIDRIELEQSMSFIGRVISGMKKRIIFATLFPAFCLIDILGGSITSLFYKTAALLSADTTNKQYYNNKFTKISDRVVKNILGLLFSPIGLLTFPSFISFYFVHKHRDKSKVYSGGGYYSEIADISTPNNIQELQNIIKSANTNKLKVMPRGSGLSQGKQFLPESSDPKQKPVIIDLANFNNITIDTKARTASVGAGIKWADLQLAANQESLGIKVAQASNVFSVGGSIGTNIHGWDHITGSLGNTILEMTVVTPAGEIKTVKPDDQLFKQIVGGFGLFGIVTNVKLQLTPNIRLLERSTAVAIDQYDEYFTKSVQQSPNIKMHYYRLSLNSKNMLQDGVAVSYVTPKKSDTSTVVTTEDYKHEGKNGNRLERIFFNLARRFSFIRNLYWRYEKSRLLGNKSGLTTHNDIMHPAINAMFNHSVSNAEWLQEYFVPKDKLADFLKQLGKLLMDNKVTLLNASVRHVSQDKSCAIGYATQGDRFSVVLCSNQSLRETEVRKARRWIKQSYDIVTSAGINGSFYLPYQQFATAEQFDKSYPASKAMAEAKDKADPNSVLASGLYTQYIRDANNRPAPSIFKTIINDPTKKKKFIGFLKNILQRVDKEKLYDLLTDILSYADTHEEIYSELLKRKHEIMPSTIGTLTRQLSSLSAIKQDLTTQATELMGDTKKINGMIEIGYPGRFVKAFKKVFDITGNITAVHEQESLSDVIQSGLPRGHNNFVPLDYNNPDLSSIETNSTDLITCFVGLHHIPADKLDQFLADIRRILRPGGSFLLVDHDIDCAETNDMAIAAHAVFNAVNDISLEEELSEVRNFQPMAYWQAKLVEHGLASHQDHAPDVAMIRDGDPSRNTMVRFVNSDKPAVRSVVSIDSSNLKSIPSPKSLDFSDLLRLYKTQTSDFKIVRDQVSAEFKGPSRSQTKKCDNLQIQ